MKNILIVGSPDRGKSFLLKSILKDFSARHNFMYDINREHTEFPNQIKNHFKGFPSIPQFLELMTKENEDGTAYVSSSNIVFEEASAFFHPSGGLDLKTRNILSRRFHTQNLNIFLFHSMGMIPQNILVFADFTFLFRTEDNPDDVEKGFKKHRKYIEAYHDVRAKTENTFFNREKKTYRDEHSKKWFHYNRCIAR